MKTSILFHILPLVFSSPLLTTPSASSSVTRSALSLFELINARTDQTANVITSPLSIHLALSMLYNGVQNNSKHQLREVLALENVSDETALEESRNLLLFYSDLLNSKLETKIELANVIFADKTMDINADYKTTLEHNLLTGVIPVDYSDNVGSVETINNWVSNKTHNLIQDLLTPGAIKQDTRLILLNAVYFNANWKLPFEQLFTDKSKFYVSKNFSVDVDMMFQENEILFGKDKDLQSQMVSLQSEDPNFTMIIILPDNEDDMENLSMNLQGMDFNRIHNSLYPENILLKMPKFKLGFKTELVSVLKDLGVTDIFDEAVADLSKISNEPLSVSNILHEAKIEVNEEGSEAAAVT